MAKKLLFALEKPEIDIPLHNNGGEQTIQPRSAADKVSTGARSDTGQLVRDSVLSIMITCQKLRISFRDYLGDRFDVASAPKVPSLADLIASRSNDTSR